MIRGSAEHKGFMAFNHSLKLPVFGIPNRHSIISPRYDTLKVLWGSQYPSPIHKSKNHHPSDKTAVCRTAEIALLTYVLSDKHVGLAWWHGSQPSMDTLILHEAMSGGLSKHTVCFDRFLEGFHLAFNALPYHPRHVPSSNEVAEYYESSTSTLLMLESVYKMAREDIYPQWFGN